MKNLKVLITLALVAGILNGSENKIIKAPYDIPIKLYEKESKLSDGCALSG